MNTQSLMRLDDYWLDSIEIKSGSAPEEQASTPETSVLPLDVSIAFDIRRHKDFLRFRVPLEVEVTSSDKTLFPFDRISIALTGVFSFPEGTPQETVDKYVPLLCLTNLFGIARGLVSQYTALFPGGAFLMPLVNMNDLIKDYLNSLAAGGTRKKKKSASKKAVGEKPPGNK